MRRRILDAITLSACWLRRNQRRAVPAGRGPVKVNLGSSLLVAPGWINIDGSLSALFSNWPRPLKRLAYRLAGTGALLDEAGYVAALEQNEFIHHNLRYGIPLPSECADYVLTSHFLEHLSARDGARLLAEARRVLRPGGRIRVAVPDLERADDDADENEFGHFARHRQMYDFGALAGLLESSGFAGVTRHQLGEGSLPDLDRLDNRPGSLFVEAEKPTT